MSLGDSTDLRAILSVLYTFVEVMRVAAEADTDDMKRDREAFSQELGKLPFLCSQERPPPFPPADTSGGPQKNDRLRRGRRGKDSFAAIVTNCADYVR